jgi:hypothetical protein
MGTDLGLHVCMLYWDDLLIVTQRTSCHSPSSFYFIGHELSAFSCSSNLSIETVHMLHKTDGVPILPTSSSNHSEQILYQRRHDGHQRGRVGRRPEHSPESENVGPSTSPDDEFFVLLSSSNLRLHTFCCFPPNHRRTRPPMAQIHPSRSYVPQPRLNSTTISRRMAQ